MSDFERGLRQAEEALRAYEPPEADMRRLRQRIDRHIEGKGGGAPRLAFGLVAAAGLALATWLLVIVPAQTTIQLGDWSGQATARAGVSRPDDETLIVHGGELRLVDSARGVRCTLTAPTKVSIVAKGVRIERGSARFEVEPKARRVPVVVAVSHGFIEVLGTVFAVEQREASGKVSVSRGRVRFTATDGRRELVEAGETLMWPLPEAEPTGIMVQEQPLPTKRRRPRGSAREKLLPAELFRTIARLRSQSRYDEAVRALREALGQDYDRLTHERASLELGLILTDHVNKRGRACAHWRRHRATYGSGRYATEIEGAMERARCSSSGAD